MGNNYFKTASKLSSRVANVHKSSEVCVCVCVCVCTSVAAVYGSYVCLVC